MRKRTLLILVALLVISVGILQLFGDPQSDEDLIRATINRVAEAAERADINAAIEPFAITYEDGDGMDRRGVYGLMWSQFKKRGPIRIYMSAIDVQVEGLEGTARFDAALMEGASDRPLSLPVNADLLTFEVGLSKQTGDWLIVHHTRRPALDLSAP